MICLLSFHSLTPFISSPDIISPVQVFRNIIVNAVKFTPAGGDAIKVSMTYEGDKLTSARHGLCSVPLLEHSLARTQFPADVKVNRSVRFPLSVGPSSIRPDALPHANPQSQLQVEFLRAAHALKMASHRRCGYLTFEITDCGCGIPEHVRGQISGEFFQFDPDRLQGGGGSGLGLWISREIIRQHGGDITFRAGEDDVGTVFSFRLPVYINERRLDNAKEHKHDKNTGSIRIYSFRSSSSASHETSIDIFSNASPSNLYLQTPRQVKSNASVDKYIFAECRQEKISYTYALGTHKILRILVVDDSDLNRRMMMKIIERAFKTFGNPVGNQRTELQLVEANDGDIAVDLVQSAALHEIPFDFVFMDNIMLRMNGPEAAQLMRKNGFQGRIVGVTGNVLPEDMQAFVCQGADCVLTKPVGLKEIKSVLCL